jgi:arylsulfatase A-like enzyme/Flp pilus assembly protein TadD
MLHGVAALLLVLAASSLGCRAAPPERVVLVSIDTLRADHVGAYGAAKAATPTLDGVAADGVRFATAIAPAPLTLPSHTSLLSALDPPRHGVRDNSLFRVPPDVPLLQERFHEAGFATAGFVGALVLDASTGIARGFDVYDDRMQRPDTGIETGFPERPADAVVDAALGWLDGAPARFFLFVHLYDPHAAYRPPLGFRLAVPGDPYAGEIAFADSEVGRLLGAIRTRWPDGRTLVAITSDHGESLGEHGEPTHAYSIYDATQRVPLLLAGPGVPKGRVVDDLARTVDVAPTLLALAHAAPLAADDAIDGRDVTPLLRGRAAASRIAYVETLATQMSFGWSPLLGLRTATHKWIRAPRPELFDLRADPGEMRDLAASEAGLAQELDAELTRRLASARPIAFADAPTAEESARLAALGYVSGAPGADETTLGRVGGPDPKDHFGPTQRGIAAAEQALAADRPRDALAALDGLVAGGFWVDMTRSRAALAAGDLAGAVRWASVVTETRPTYAAGWLQLGEAHEAAGDAAPARSAFETARRLAPRDAAPALALARVAEAAGDEPGARALLEQAAALPSGSDEALVLLAARALRARDDAAAHAVLARAGDAAHRGDAPGRLAGAELAAGRPEAALARIDAALDASGRDAPGLRLRGALLLLLGRREEAVSALEEAAAFAPDDPRLRSDLAFALALRGQDRDVARAESLAESAAAATQAADTRASAAGTLAAVRLARGDAASALALLDAALREAPRSLRSVLLAQRGAALRALGREREARAAFADARADATRIGVGSPRLDEASVPWRRRGFEPGPEPGAG